jgi:hypothetical protein
VNLAAKEKNPPSGACGADRHNLARSSFYAVTPKNSVTKGLKLWIITGVIQAPLGDAFRSDSARQLLRILQLPEV